MIFFCRTDEQDAAFPSVTRCRNPLHRQGFTVQHFACKRRIKAWAKGILAKYANRKRIALCCRGIGGPLDKSTEVIKINSLHVILGDFRLLGSQDGNMQKSQHQDNCGGALPRAQVTLRNTTVRTALVRCGVTGAVHGYWHQLPSPAALSVDASLDSHERAGVPTKFLVRGLSVCDRGPANL